MSFKVLLGFTAQQLSTSRQLEQAAQQGRSAVRRRREVLDGKQWRRQELCVFSKWHVCVGLVWFDCKCRYVVRGRIVVSIQVVEKKSV